MIDKDLSPVLRQKCFVWDKPLWKRDWLPGQQVEELLREWFVSRLYIFAENHAEPMIIMDIFHEYK